MAEQDTLAALREKLKEVPGITEEQLNLLFSEKLITQISPMITALAAAQIEGQQQVKDRTGEKLALLADKFVDTPLLKPVSTSEWHQWLENAKSGDFIDEFVDRHVKDWLYGPLLTTGSLLIQFATLVTSSWGVTSERQRQTLQRQIRPYLLDLPTLIKEAFRNPGNIAWVKEQMQRMGIADDKIEVYLDNQTYLPSLEMLKVLWNREKISDEELDQRLEEMQFRPKDKEHIKTTLKVYPQIGDIIRFAVREVFDESFAASAGLFQDMPAAFVEEAKKAGLDPKYAQMYWGAHWIPISVNQAFEMFQRDVITADQLNTILRIQDIMPGQREDLTKIAYKTIARVDIRRIYDMGMLTFEELITRYRHNGFSPENAELLAEWTEEEYGYERKERTRSDIRRLYKIGEFVEADVIEQMSILGYREEIAKEDILRVDLELAEKRIKSLLRVWKKGLINDSYTQNEVREFMRAEGMRDLEIEDYIFEWQAEKDTKSKGLALIDLKKMYLKYILGAEAVGFKLGQQGYRREDIALLIQLWEAERE